MGLVQSQITPSKEVLYLDFSSRDDGLQKQQPETITHSHQSRGKPLPTAACQRLSITTKMLEWQAGEWVRQESTYRQIKRTRTANKQRPQASRKSKAVWVAPAWCAHFSYKISRKLKGWRCWDNQFKLIARVVLTCQWTENPLLWHFLLHSTHSVRPGSICCATSGAWVFLVTWHIIWNTLLQNINNVVLAQWKSINAQSRGAYLRKMTLKTWSHFTFQYHFQE